MKQHDKILQLLKERPYGLNSFEFRHMFIQLPVRISELKELGCKISSLPQKNRSVNYILEETTAPSPLYKWVFDGGIARRVLITEKKEEEPEQTQLFT